MIQIQQQHQLAIAANIDLIAARIAMVAGDKVEPGTAVALQVTIELSKFVRSHPPFRAGSATCSSPREGSHSPMKSMLFVDSLPGYAARVKYAHPEPVSVSVAVEGGVVVEETIYDERTGEVSSPKHNPMDLKGQP